MVHAATLKHLGALALVAVPLGCASGHRDVGGTPGPPAVSCASGDLACETVRDSLEAVRGNIGGWCGTPNASSHMRLTQLGAAAEPHLVVALGDRDAEVAAHAAWVLVDIGRGDRVAAHCAEHPGGGACHRLAELTTSIRDLHVTGHWEGLGHVGGEPMGARRPIRLSLESSDDRLSGRVCVGGADRCRAVQGSLEGRRLELVGTGTASEGGSLAALLIAEGDERLTLEGDVCPADCECTLPQRSDCALAVSLSRAPEPSPMR